MIQRDREGRTDPSVPKPRLLFWTTASHPHAAGAVRSPRRAHHPGQDPRA